MHRLRGRLTYSNVMVTVLAVLVLGGGTAYAASHLGKESVGARQLKKGAVTPAKLSPAAATTLIGPKGASGATGPEGPKGDTGSQGSAGIVRAFRKSNPISPASKLGTSLFGTEVLSLAVPPGRYFVTTNFELRAGVADFVECRLINGHGGPESEGPSMTQSVPANAFENVTMSDLFFVRPGQELNVECSHSSGTTAVDNINIVAVQVQETIGTFDARRPRAAAPPPSRLDVVAGQVPAARGDQIVDLAWAPAAAPVGDRRRRVLEHRLGDLPEALDRIG
jgi:hypothetical protein